MNTREKFLKFLGIYLKNIPFVSDFDFSRYFAKKDELFKEFNFDFFLFDQFRNWYWENKDAPEVLQVIEENKEHINKMRTEMHKKVFKKICEIERKPVSLANMRFRNSF